MKKRSKFSKIFDIKMWFYDFVKITSAIPVLVEERMKRIYVNGKKPKGLFKGSYIICANHKAYDDPVVLSDAVWNRRICFVATKEVFYNKFVGWMIKRLGAIKIDRENTAVESFKKAKDALARGHVIGMFPESHVSKEEKIRNFKSGVAMMAAICDAPILPIYMAPRKNRWKRQVVVIGNKIDYKQYINGKFPTVEEIHKITNILKHEEIKLKEIYDSWKNRKRVKYEEVIKANV